MINITSLKCCILICIFLPNISQADTPNLFHTPHCLYSCPVASELSGEIVVREIYTLQNNSTTKFADWVAYKVEHENFGKTRNRYWKKDPDLNPNVTMGREDYKYANKEIGVDRWHLAPLATFSATEYWSYTNFLSNIAPQKSNLNQGIWKSLESNVRQVSKRNNVSLYVITGTLYDEHSNKLPHSMLIHDIPDEFYKLIYIPTENGVEYVSFMIPQIFSKDDFCDYKVELGNLEAASGYKFFFNAESIVKSDWLTVELGC